MSINDSRDKYVNNYQFMHSYQILNGYSNEFLPVFSKNYFNQMIDSDNIEFIFPLNDKFLRSMFQVKLDNFRNDFKDSNNTFWPLIDAIDNKSSHSSNNGNSKRKSKSKNTPPNNNIPKGNLDIRSANNNIFGKNRYQNPLHQDVHQVSQQTHRLTQAAAGNIVADNDRDDRDDKENGQSAQSEQLQQLEQSAARDGEKIEREGEGEREGEREEQEEERSTRNKSTSN